MLRPKLGISYQLVNLHLVHYLTMLLAFQNIETAFSQVAEATEQIAKCKEILWQDDFSYLKI